MRYKAIFFDLDGTLLPMDQSEFLRGYFKELSKKLAPFGLDIDILYKAVMGGTAAMVANDGTQTNYQRFWDTFESVTGLPGSRIDPVCLDFYINEFRHVKSYTGDNPQARQAVETAHRKADTVVLATNPFFPRAGQLMRLSWVGLKESDFECITSYETCRFCKPNPDYFRTLCAHLALSPADCLMIGNDEKEDMLTCTAAGLDGYLVTDCMIADPQHPWAGPSGRFIDMISMLETL